MNAQSETRPPQREPGSTDTHSLSVGDNYIQPAGEMSTGWSLSDHLHHFETRVLADALTQATSQHWRARAQAFTDAIPRAGDYNGHASDARLAERTRALQSKAQACQQAAELAPYETIAELVETELATHAEPTVRGVAA